MLLLVFAVVRYSYAAERIMFLEWSIHINWPTNSRPSVILIRVVRFSSERSCATDGLSSLGSIVYFLRGRLRPIGMRRILIEVSVLGAEVKVLRVTSALIFGKSWWQRADCANSHDLSNLRLPLRSNQPTHHLPTHSHPLPCPNPTASTHLFIPEGSLSRTPCRDKLVRHRSARISLFLHPSSPSPSPTPTPCSKAQLKYA